MNPVNRISNMMPDPDQPPIASSNTPPGAQGFDNTPRPSSDDKQTNREGCETFTCGCVFGVLTVVMLILTSAGVRMVLRGLLDLSK